MSKNNIDRQAWLVFEQRYPGQQPKKGQIKEIKREIRSKHKSRHSEKHPIIPSIKEIAHSRVSLQDQVHTV